jgi:serine protease Do
MDRRALLALTALAAPALARPAPAAAQRSALTALPDFADLAAQVLPAVVNIATVGPAAEMPPEFRGTPLERPFRERRGRQPVQGQGSGFIIDAAGLVVTNAHVIGAATRIIVALQSGQEYPARLVGSDELTDLALLRIEARGLPTVPWGSSATMRVGNWVVAAGNPFGLGGSVTVGILSARGREIGAGPFDDFLQTDAPINPGNSGGPLFNLAGEVIGVNTAIFSPSGASVGIGFAVPSDLARGVVDQLRGQGRVERGWLGVAVQDQAEGGRAPRGVLVSGVERGSPAARAGLRPGDAVLAIAGERVESTRALIRGIAAITPGERVSLSILRDGRPQDIVVQVGRRPSAPPG